MRVRAPRLGRLARPVGELSGGARVWLLNGILAGIAAILFFGVVVDIPAVPGAAQVPWFVLVVLFYLAEVLVVHLQFRREVHTFSLSEIPFVIALFFATPVDFVTANVVGAAAALAIHRRQAPIKLVFNVSQFALGAILGVTVFHVIRTIGVPLAPTDWVAALAASAIMNVVGVTTIAMAIGLSERRVELQKLSQVFKFGLTVGVANTVVVLTAIMVVGPDPAALWLLAIPAVVLYLAYRAYMSERDKHESLEFLYESTTILQRTPELDRAIVELLAHARRMFRAEVAELTLVPSGDSNEALRTSLGPDDATDVMLPVDQSELGETWSRMLSDGRALLFARSTPDATIDVSTRFRLRDALVAPLRGDRGVLGMLVVGDRLGDVSSFDEEDLRLLDALARHAGIALENGRLGKSLTQVTELKEQLKYQAFHDSLTGLANRALFLERVAEATKRRVEGGSRGSVVLFIDLDDFKTVNDSLGHAAGDVLLVAVSERLRSCLRTSDLPARLGGDEFAILLDGGELQHALVIGDRIIAALQAPFTIGDQEVVVGASVGIAASGPRPEAPDELLRNADVAMYTAKAHGKGRVAVFEPAMHAAVVARHALTGELQRAVDREQFIVRYQPIVDLVSGRITGAEALVRWKRPNGTIVPPGDFIPLAEETGLILPLGRWVLETACRQAARWQEIAPDRAFHLGVNLSPRQVQHPAFIEEVAAILASTGLDPAMLMLEITETVMMQDTEATITKLDALKALGIQLAVDDFGTGYSSLSYLRRFPVDVLKMAKPFVDAAGTGREDSAFARAIIALGKSLRLRIIAEGIEDVDQLDELRELGCDLGQGFYFAEPLEADAITDLLAGKAGSRTVVPIAPDTRRPISIRSAGPVTRR